MPAHVELARRDGIELIHTGSWSALSGSWTPTPADILAAVEAQQCPAVRRPRLKLGHTDTRFNSGGDGEPALGWFENLRAADDGHTLIGDQVALPWLSAVQAAAYPDRSIEGNYRHVCALGHTHPFVVTAVSLLGVTPPAVATLRSVQDLPAMLGVAASEEVPEGAQHVSVTIRAGRHAFDETKVKRDGDGQFAHKAGGGSASSGTPLKDGLNLGGRISLGRGETLAGSDSVKGSGIVAAAVDGPDGRKLRLGFVDPDDTRRWRGADGGSTVVLDSEGVAGLQAAIPDMLRWADEGKAHLKAFEKRDKELRAKERAIVNKQYPELTKAGAKELERIDQDLTETAGSLDNTEANLRKRYQRVPDEQGRQEMSVLDGKIQKARASGDDKQVAALQLRQRSLLWGHSEADMRELDAINATPWQQRTAEQKKRYEQLRRPAYSATEPMASTWTMLFDQDLKRSNELHRTKRDLDARREVLTTVSTPLSRDDQGDLDDIRMAIDQNNESWGEFTDGAYLTDGLVSGEWGDIVYEVTMSHSPEFQLTVRPAGAGPDWELRQGMGETDAAELKKLAALLDRMSGTAKVSAAAGDGVVHTGAMVALIPAAEDAARLAVDGGEPADELHVTLRYLGPADQIPDRARARLVEAVSRSATSLPAFDADAFSIAAFNPGRTDRDPCITLGVSGQVVEMAHDLANMAVADVAAEMTLDLPEPHRPFHAHLTLGYTGDLTKVAAWAYRVGPVRFDRMRVVFGGDATDIPLVAADWAALPPVAASTLPDSPAHTLPAAEPESNTTQEDIVSLSDEMRSRLGLDADADETAALAAIDALKTAADKPAAPTEEMVAASAAATEKAAAAEAENNGLRKEVQILASQMKAVSDELAATKAEKAATVKASVLDEAARLGKFKPADRETWEADYDEAPGAVTRVLASIAPGTAVPVTLSGTAGGPEPVLAGGGTFTDADYNRVFGITEEV